MPYVVRNVTEKWLILNDLNVKIPPQEMEQELVIDDDDYDSPDIQELKNRKEIKITKLAKKKLSSGKERKPTKQKKTQQKKTQQKKTSPKLREQVGRKKSKATDLQPNLAPKPKKEEKLEDVFDEKDNQAVVMEEGIPVKKEFQKTPEATIFIDDKGIHQSEPDAEPDAESVDDAFIEVE